MIRKILFCITTISSLLLGNKPDFIILGAQKCGTTSLFKYIIQHPRIIPARKKEINFFNMEQNFNNGIDWYIKHFPQKKYNKLTGEATTGYLTCENTPIRIKEYYPDTKFIIIMRDPAKRAFSAYNHYISRNNMPGRPESAQEFRTFDECVEAYFLGHEIDCVKKYISRSIYITHIRQWLKLFPREQFLFLIFEEFIVDPVATTNQVFSFLGLEPYSKLTIKKLNAGNYKDRIMSPETEQFLRDFYRPYNQQLEEFLGRSLPWA